MIAIKGIQEGQPGVIRLAGQPQGTGHLPDRLAKGLVWVHHKYRWFS
jgi:hypothetical protein